VVVLHQLDEVLRCADRALLLDNGRMIACGPTRDVISDGPVRRVYDVELISRGGFGYRLVSSAR
jgi:iron complex transport system ATP-binding protein